jgi:hypothetical protein
MPHRSAGCTQNSKSSDAFSVNGGHWGVLVVGAFVRENRPFENGEIRENLEEQFIWELEY